MGTTPQRVILVRHGLVDYCTGQLSNAGREYSLRLPSILKRYKVEFVGCDEAKRCIDTIEPLVSCRNLTIKTYSKKDFEKGKPLKDVRRYSYSVLCYRIESVNHLLSALKLPLYTNANRDRTYEEVLIVLLEGAGAKIEEKIGTGYSRVKSKGT